MNGDNADANRQKHVTSHLKSITWGLIAGFHYRSIEAKIMNNDNIVIISVGKLGEKNLNNNC